MGPLAHFGISLPLAAGVSACTGDPVAGVAALLAGTLIDVDHALDYVMTRGLRIDASALRTGEYFRESGRALVLLHSYELIVGVAIIVAILVRPSVGLGIALGAFVHLVCDVVFYRFTPLCYSFAYRFRAGFALESFRYVPLGAEGGAKKQ
jgi:membrane-bound metal-dependent hydrolase YbcI (DUF457 family)